MDKRQTTGRQGEDIAAAFLIKQGYEIIERNWRCSIGEVDIIACRDDVLVFVEVRTRRGQRFGTAEESITVAKQTRLIALAETFWQEHVCSLRSWRIDVVAIQLGQHPPRINHIENAVGW